MLYINPSSVTDVPVRFRISVPRYSFWRSFCQIGMWRPHQESICHYSCQFFTCAQRKMNCVRSIVSGGKKTSTERVKQPAKLFSQCHSCHLNYPDDMHCFRVSLMHRVHVNSYPRTPEVNLRPTPRQLLLLFASPKATCAKNNIVEPLCYPQRTCRSNFWHQVEPTSRCSVASSQQFCGRSTMASQSALWQLKKKVY